MNFLDAITTVLIPLLTLVIPGIVLVRRPRTIAELPGQAARTVLWSISLLTLLSLAVTVLRLPVYLAGLLAAIAAAYFLIIGRKPKLQTLWYTLAISLAFLLLFALFSAPYLLYHDGLPTGDSQKAILWAQQILQNQELPDYNQAGTLLNRDPVDFYTPGLHTLTALVMQLIPRSPLGGFARLTSIGFLSIALSIGVALVATALALEVFQNKLSILATALIPFLILTNFRFLRYLREPGYHFQNVVGELLLFGLIYLVLSLTKQWRWSTALLATVVVSTLALTHQFSTFLAAFLLLPIILTFISYRRDRIVHLVKQQQIYAILIISALVLIIVSGFAIGLHQKIPHIFTTTPHLIQLTPNLIDYPKTMGTTWFIAGIVGLTLFTRHILKDRQRDIPGLGFASPAEALREGWVLSVFVLLLLSQGPRLGIDIPPVRTLFYSVVPLSIAAAYFFAWLAKRFGTIPSTLPRRAAYLLLALLIIMPATSSVAKAYSLSHTVRTNSTLSAGQLMLVEFLKEQPGAVLIDDYNRRSASWLVLAGQPMFTRIAANLERQMNEAGQSEKRLELYLKQLDFEKIFAQGSKPELINLMNKHNIRYLTGIEKSSRSAFQYNPALVEVARGDDIVLYKAATTKSGEGANLCGVDVDAHVVDRRGRDKLRTNCAPTTLSNWLLRPSTLVNDIGDREDTFEHLPASLRATRLSKPKFINQHTFRTTTAPLIPLRFNVGDFVRLLWDKEKTGRPDISVEFYISLMNQVTPLSLITPSGSVYPVTSGTSLTKIPADEVPFDEKGFITLTIHNPTQKPVDIDFIALGSARTP